MNTIRQLLLSDWQAKLLCMLVAVAIWYLIRENLPQQLEWRPYTPPPTATKEPARVD